MGFEIQSIDEKTVFFLSGSLDAKTSAGMWKPLLKKIKKSDSSQIVLDLKQINYIDTSGAMLICQLDRQAEQTHNKPAEIINLDPSFSSLLDLAFQQEKAQTIQPENQRLTFVENQGRRLANALNEAKEFITFVGMITWALAQSLKHPGKIRWGESFKVAEKAGVDALPIVALISFIVGLVMAFQAAIPMRMFGAEIYVANLIGIAMVRELGPLMTAIVLAGRSSSAFAAEIGTMRINEEIDALTVMGIDPVKFLIVPRIIASTIMTPLLTVFSNLVGIIGGAIVITSMGYPVISYYNQIVGFVGLNNLVGGLVKCFVFGILIAATGCIRGYQTGSGPSAVGTSTTKAVVTGIVLIAVFDGVFSIVYYYLGI